jgi:hypothetical protein
MDRNHQITPPLKIMKKIKKIKKTKSNRSLQELLVNKDCTFKCPIKGYQTVIEICHYCNVYGSCDVFTKAEKVLLSEHTLQLPVPYTVPKKEIKMKKKEVKEVKEEKDVKEVNESKEKPNDPNKVSQKKFKEHSNILNKILVENNLKKIKKSKSKKQSIMNFMASFTELNDAELLGVIPRGTINVMCVFLSDRIELLEKEKAKEEKEKAEKNES